MVGFMKGDPAWIRELERIANYEDNGILDGLVRREMKHKNRLDRLSSMWPKWPGWKKALKSVGWGVLIAGGILALIGITVLIMVLIMRGTANLNQLYHLFG